MNGRRTCLGLAENWLRIELPKVSAVMPVPSDTKYTVRMAMAVSAAPAAAGLRWYAPAAATRRRGHDGAGVPRRIAATFVAPAHCRPYVQNKTTTAPADGAANAAGSLRATPPQAGDADFQPSRSCHPMPRTLPATALVVPFEELRMTDVESVGGKNASLGETHQPALGQRRARAGRLRHHRARVPRDARPRGAGRAHRVAPGHARHRRRARARRRRRRDPRLDRVDAVPAGARGRGAQRRSPG